MSVLRKFWNGRIRRVSAGRRHHLADSRISRTRTKRLGKIFEEAEAVDHAIWLAFIIHNRRDSASTAGKSPCRAKLRFGTKAVEPLRYRLKARRRVGEKEWWFKIELLQYPGSLRVERAGAC